MQMLLSPCNMKKIIAISTRLTQTQYENRDGLSLDWYTFLPNVLPDFAWILLPNAFHSIELLCKQKIFSGILLSGGDDLGAYPERDETESFLLNYACQQEIPVLGVCRGAQMINQYFGGQLKNVDPMIHVNKRHTISLQDSLYSGKTTAEVNSYHNYGITLSTLAKPLIPFAHIEETNTVEAFFHCSLPVYGIMWHPEREKNINKLDKTFFQNIFRN